MRVSRQLAKHETHYTFFLKIGNLSQEPEPDLHLGHSPARLEIANSFNFLSTK